MGSVGKRSRDKGKRGEREWAKFLSAHGFPAYRGMQFSGRGKGGEEAPDVVCDTLPYHHEVKRVERLNLQAAMEQSIEDAEEGKTPIVAHKKNNKQWLVTMLAEDWIELVGNDDEDA